MASVKGKKGATRRKATPEVETNGRGMPPTAESKVIERFTRVGENTVLYEFAVDDPAYEEIWGGQIPFNRFDDKLYEYACHEGNYALEGILRGARYQEREGGRR